MSLRNPPNDNSSEKDASCHSLVWKIGPYVDGELCREECDEVEAHLAGCQDCAKTAREFRQLDQLAQEKVPPVSGEEWSKLWGKVTACLQSKHGSHALPDDAAGESGTGKSSTAKSSVKVVEIAAGASAPGIQARWLPKWALIAGVAAALIFGVSLGFHLASSPPHGAKEEESRAANDNVHVSGPSPEIRDESNETTLIYHDF